MTCAIFCSLLATVTFLDEELPAGWTKYAVKEQGFAVAAPGEFRRQVLTEKDPDGRDLRITLYRMAVAGDTYVVAISEFSPEYMKQPVKTIFDNARNGSVERSKGRLVREQDIKLGDFPGRECVVEAGNKAGYVRARIYVANQRQYAVMVASKTEAGIETADAQRFFASFKLTAVEKKEPMKERK